MCDNTSSINLSDNLVLYSRTKHIETRHHFIRDHVEEKDVVFQHVYSKYQLANIFTEPLATKPVLKYAGNWGLLISPMFPKKLD